MKFIIVLTTPSGKQFAASKKDGKFAMVPCVDGTIHGALGFDTAELANKFLVDFKNLIGEEEFKNIEALNPRIVCLALQQ